METVKNPGNCNKALFNIEIGPAETVVTLKSCARYSGQGITEKVLVSACAEPDSATRTLVSEGVSDDERAATLELITSTIGAECTGICYWCDLFEPTNITEKAEVVAV